MLLLLMVSNRCGACSLTTARMLFSWDRNMAFSRFSSSFSDFAGPSMDSKSNCNDSTLDNDRPSSFAKIRRLSGISSGLSPNNDDEVWWWDDPSPATTEVPPPIARGEPGSFTPW